MSTQITETITKKGRFLTKLKKKKTIPEMIKNIEEKNTKKVVMKKRTQSFMVMYLNSDFIDYGFCDSWFKLSR